MEDEKDFQRMNKKSNEKSSKKIQKPKELVDKKTIAELWKEEHYKKLGLTVFLSGLV